MSNENNRKADMNNTDIHDEVYEKSWAGQYWGPDGALAKQRRRTQNPQDYSALSSTCYSAATQAYARFKTGAFPSKLLWGFRAWRCLREAERLSDAFARAVKQTDRTPDQTDVRARILFRRKRYAEARDLTKAALARENLSLDTRVLLTIGLAEIHDATGSAVCAEEAYRSVEEMLPHVKATTSVRHYKSLAWFYHEHGDLTSMRRAADKAREIAAANGLFDQLHKIKPLLKKTRRAARDD